jgi:hypothetical protein
MKSILVFAFMFSLSISGQAQVMFVERFEYETKYTENDFMIMNRPGGLIAFRTQPEKGFNLRSRLQFFLTDYQLESDKFSEIRIRDSFELTGYDMEGDYFYVLFQKGSSANSERYIVEINLQTEETKEISLEYIHAMDMQEFFVLNRKAVFLGISEMRPLVQIFNMEDNDVFTVQGVYSKDTNVLQMRKDSELGLIDLLVSKRDRLKIKQMSVLSFDEYGSKIREINLENPTPRENEFTEGILSPFYNYQQNVIGTYGRKRREAYLGIYIADINEFGEYDINYYTLEDFPNFYNYLSERHRERKLKQLERRIKREKDPVISDIFTTREIIPFRDGFLIYNDHFNATNTRYIPRDGVYANDAYRFYPRGSFFQGPGLGFHSRNPMLNSNRDPYNSLAWQQNGSYKFLSSYFIFINREGQVIWDNAFSLANKNRFSPGKFGEVAFDGEKLHYMYLEGNLLHLSYMKNGEVVFENQEFEIELINDNERIRDTRESSLSLSWWYSDYYLLSGKQRIRFLNDQGKEENRDVFFLTKIKVDGDLFVPEE